MNSSQVPAVQVRVVMLLCAHICSLFASVNMVYVLMVHNEHSEEQFKGNLGKRKI